MFRNTKGTTAFQLTMTTIAMMAAVSLLMAFTTTKARAQTVSTYVGLHAGYSVATTELSAPTIIPGLALDGVGSKGLVGGIHGGVDVFFANSPWFIGAWAAYDWSHVDAKLTTPGGSATARLGDAWSIGGRLGLAAGKVSPYVLLGYKQQETSLSGLATTSMPTLKGLVYGAGADYALAQNLKIGAQAAITKFDAADINTSGIVMKPEALEVTLRASLSFGGPVATSAAPLK